MENGKGTGHVIGRRGGRGGGRGGLIGSAPVEKSSFHSDS